MSRLYYCTQRNRRMKSKRAVWIATSIMLFLVRQIPAGAADVEPVAVEAQPLAANVNRLMETLQMLGAPLPKEITDRLAQAGKARDAAGLQKRLDAHVLFVVSLNPESRVKVERGPAPAVLQQAGFAP